MKRLIINNIEVMLDKGLTIPYSVKNFNLENPTLINIDKSKSIELKRCNVNDEAFGYLANNSRLNTSVDSGNGIKFNPIKKNIYQLLEDSELLSEGIVNILEANDNVIIIELYDALLEKFNSLDDKYINDVDLFTERKINNDFIVNPPTGLVPVFGLDDTTLSMSSITCKQVNEEGFATLTKVDIPESKPIDLNTFKSYEARFATSIDNMITKINDEWDIIDNQYDFEGLHLLGNKLKQIPYYGDRTITRTTGGFISAAPGGTQDNGTFEGKLTTTGNEISNAQKLNITTNISLALRTTLADTVRQYENEDSARSSSYFIDGDLIGRLKCFSTIKFYKGSNIVDARTNETIIDLIWGSNYHKVGNELRYDGSVANTFTASIIDFDYYRLETIITNLVNPTGYNFYDDNFMWFFKKEKLAVLNAQYSMSLTYKIVETNGDKMNTNLKINTKSILPKIKVKDFILALVKTFNLHTEIVNGKIVLREKSFKYSAELPIINLNNTTQKRLITEQKLILDNEKASDTRLDNYKIKYDRTYGEQIVDLGYTINTKKREIKLPISIPFWQTGVNYWAYDGFNSYRNGGYSRRSRGSFAGLNDKLTFGYLDEVKEQLYINDDIVDEITEDTADYGMVNESLFYYPSANYFNNFKMNSYTFSRTQKYKTITPTHVVLNGYKTLSPYKWKNSIIYKSLELNKPLETYGYVNDSVYPAKATHYNNYFGNMFSQLYDQDAFIIEVDMLIKSRIDFETIFNWNNTDYVIYEIDEYEPSRMGVYRVKLLRVMDRNKLTNLYSKDDSIEITNVSAMSSVPAFQPNWFTLTLNINKVSGLNTTHTGIAYSFTNENPTINDLFYQQIGELTNISLSLYSDNFDKQCFYKAYIKLSDGSILYTEPRWIYIPSAIVAPSVIISTSLFNEGFRVHYNTWSDGGSPITQIRTFIKAGWYVDEYSNDDVDEFYEIKDYSTWASLSPGQVYSILTIVNNLYFEHRAYDYIEIPAYIPPYLDFVRTATVSTTSINTFYSYGAGTDSIETVLLLWKKNGTPTFDSYDGYEELPAFSDYDGEFLIEGLTAGSSYGIRLGAVVNDNNGYPYYGPTTTGFTQSNPPIITSSITGAELDSNVRAYCSYQVDNPSLITERGVCWTRNVIPTRNDSKQFDTVQANGNTTFNCTITPQYISEYWFRPYIMIGTSISYGSAKRIGILAPREGSERTLEI